MLKKQEYKNISDIDFDIREMRISKGISRVEAAKYCGVSCNTMSFWENGVSKKILKENYDKLVELFS